MAGAGRRVFQPGEVLTASNVMSYLQDQAVQVYAGTAARGSAIGTAVSEGMVSYLADANQLQFFESGSWRTFAATSGLPVANGGTGGTTVAAAQDSLGIGFVPVSPGSIAHSGGTATVNSVGKVTFTNITSLSLNDVFTSSYENYRIHIYNLQASAASNAVNFRLRAAGSNYTGNQHYLQGSVNVATSAPGTYSVINGTFIELGVPPATDAYYHARVDIFRPQANTICSLSGQSYGLTSGNVAHFVYGALINAASARTGFTIYPSLSGNFTGILQVYGYNE